MSHFSKNLKKFTSIIFCFFALTSVSKADDCDNIPGIWKGEENLKAPQKECKWDVIANISKRGDNVLGKFFFYNGQGGSWICKNGGHQTFYGSCKDGIIKFDYVLGVSEIVGNSMIIHSYNEQKDETKIIKLKKQRYLLTA